MEHGIHVSLAPEHLGTLWGVPLTNTLITSWVVVGLLIFVAYFVGSRLRLVPSKPQLVFEWLIASIYEYVAETLGSRTLARRYLPLLLTIFLFVLTSNLLEFMPGVGSIGIFESWGGEFIPLFRSVNTDLNVTLMLAIVAVIAIEVAGVAALGFFRYTSKFINFSSPLNFVVGLIELVSEVSRLVSFSFRLFGNIFAGEVLLGVIAFFVPYLLPIPMMTFEIFVGFIQAVVFSMLTLFFIKLAIMDPHAAH